MRKTIFFGLLIFLSMSVMSVWGWEYENESANEMLLKAVRQINLEDLEDAISKGAQVNYLDSMDKTVLMYACENNWYLGVKRLLEAGAIASFRNFSGQTAMMFAVKYCNDIRFVTLLRSYGADINEKDNTSKTVLMYAVANQSEVIINHLLNEGVNIGATDMFRNDAGMHAVKEQNLYALSTLRNANAVNWQRTDTEGNDIFMLACLSGKINLVTKVLMIAGAVNLNFEGVNDSGKPLLIRLIENNIQNPIIGLVMDRHDPETILHLKDINNKDVRYWAKRKKNTFVLEKLDEIEKEWAK
ncbi:MAG: ankyrin repeat domain-containing protein [Spirochaetales bacterium]|nr:ankyrin repeat domain-containing protein [Spirochaetales bacterium]